jgi:hypothetical protein
MLNHRRGSAALEFVLVVPFLLSLVVGVYDIAEVLILRQELADAAEQIAQAANKLSLSSTTAATVLTASQMQNAMSTIYAAIPGLALGNGSGHYSGAYGVTLSSVVFLPLCQLANGCTPESSINQTPYVLWSASLREGGSQLGAAAYRPCSAALTAVSQFPDNSTQLTRMIKPSGVVIPPQLVADVYYTYTPFFSWFLSSKTYWASATMPSSAGGTDQEITLSPTAAQSGVTSCTLP